MATPLTQLVFQMLRFGTVGVLNTAVGLSAIYAFMYFLHADPVSANVIGYLVGVSISCWLNKLWTFESKHKISDVLPRYVGVIAYTVLSFTWRRIYVFPQTSSQA